MTQCPEVRGSLRCTHDAPHPGDSHDFWPDADVPRPTEVEAERNRLAIKLLVSEQDVDYWATQTELLTSVIRKLAELLPAPRAVAFTPAEHDALVTVLRNDDDYAEVHDLLEEEDRP